MQAKGLLSGTVLLCRNQQRHHLLPAAAPAAKLPRCLSHSFACSASTSQGARQRVVPAAASASLEAGTSADSDDKQRRRRSSAQVPLEEVPLMSEAGRDYEPLRDALAAGEFEKADDITRDELIQLAGPGAVKRNWVYFTEVKFIANQDLQTIDALWRAASDGNFGYSVQKEIWLQQSKYWSRFFKKIEWVQGQNNIYKKWPMEFTYGKEAPKGHLPLTNALRGTQLFQAILEHPAFVKEGKDNGGRPDWMN